MHNNCDGSELEEWQKNIKSYAQNKNNTAVSGQAHHISQDAAFRDVIPHDEGLTIKLEGNVRTDIPSPHYEAHKSLEGFWDKYRKGGDLFGSTPTVGQYNRAAYDSLVSAGLSNDKAARAIKLAYEQQQKYGLSNGSLVPRIPGRMPLK